MRLLALVLAISLTASATARADLPSPLGWLRGNDGSGETKSTKWSGGRASTVVTKMANAPKRLVTGTKNLLTPKKPATQRKHLGAVAIHKKGESDVAEQGFFGRLFNPQPETSPATVNEWMALDKPKLGANRSIR